MADSFEEIALHQSIVRKQWLSRDVAVQEVIAFEKLFGASHFLLACHAALPSLLTPELLHSIHLNFLDQQHPRIPWVADMDFLLSPLCRPLERDLFEVEPMVREALLFKLEERYGWQRLQNVADFLLQYLHRSHASKQNPIVPQLYGWIAQAYLQPDNIVQEMLLLLNKSVDPQSSDYQTLPKKLRIVRAMELLAEPLRYTALQEEYASLVHSARVLAYTLYGNKQTFPTRIYVVESEESAVQFPPAVQQWLSTFAASPKILETEENRSDEYFLSPYYDYDAVRDASMFFGRRYELRTLFNAIQKRQCFSIVGSRHIGKSSLLKFLADRELQQRYGYDLHDRIFILTDWREYLQKSREDFFRSVCEQIISQSRAILTLQPPPEDLRGEDRFKKLLEDVKDAGFRPVLLMDVFDRVTRNPQFDPDFFSFLRSLAGIYDLISYVTASIKPLHEVSYADSVASSPFFDIFQTYVLSSLTPEETQQLITLPAERAGLAFTPEEVAWVIALAGRHPFYVQVTSRCLFDEKVRQNEQNVDLNLVQRRVYYELEPYFVDSWNDLSEDQKQSLKPEIMRPNPERRKMPELSECSLFCQKVRELLQVNGTEISLKDLKDVLDNIEDNDFLENSRFAEMHYITVSMQANPQTKKGVLVRDLLKAGFERMQAGGLRNDSAPEWRLYNILYYHYFRYHLPNARASARLGIGSMHQFYREQNRALQVLLKEILDLEQNSLNSN